MAAAPIFYSDIRVGAEPKRDVRPRLGMLVRKLDAVRLNYLEKPSFQVVSRFSGCRLLAPSRTPHVADKGSLVGGSLLDTIEG
jgi:hypothetical protein